ncbi:M57 family metalloprotease [uncultured Aquimarina sp.]|uniref:M57 family metalloprotease n=1 Tax=uncultured Aquimarina sp. TaxID=575652 RepID=UPI0026361DE6|nr:M57 family metalloprotease [uncultured Aquimarina sp.]
MKLNFLRIGAVALTSLLLTTTSCSDEGLEIAEEVNESQLPKDVLNKVLELKLDPNGFEVREVANLDGTIRQVVITSGDMAMDKDRFLQIPASKDGVSKQYQTEFIIDTDIHQEVNIIVYTGDQIFNGDTPIVEGLSEAAQQGVKDAVENWNSVWGSKLKLTADFSSSPNFDSNFYETSIAVDLSLNGFGGFADFPDADGNPGNYLFISPGASSNAANFPDAIEHLITHELGHTIGFRHTDWNSRQSCVDQGLEDAPSVETNPPARIFGTLPSIPGILEQEDSIMNACFGETDGELNFFDENGLRNLYSSFY